MPRELRFMTMILPNLEWAELLRRCRYLEGLGFDIVGFADHFVDWTGAVGPWFECWTMLTAIAAGTQRIRLSSCVTQIPLRNPALLAHQALTVDHISNGRLELGLGLGLTNDPSYGMMGLPNWGYPERAARLKEYVQILDKLLSDGTATYDGKYYQLKNAVMQPRPVQRPRPPIVIAAMGPAMLKRAAELADNWNSISFAANFEAQITETRERIRTVDAHCAVIGRDPRTLRRSYLMLDVQARHTGGLISYYQSKEIFADQVRQVIDLGISEIGLYYPRHDEQLPMFETIAAEVIPMLKAEYASREKA